MTESVRPLESFYRRYNETCNAHRFSRLGEFVAEDVVVNGAGPASLKREGSR